MRTAAIVFLAVPLFFFAGGMFQERKRRRKEGMEKARTPALWLAGGALFFRFWQEAAAKLRGRTGTEQARWEAVYYEEVYVGQEPKRQRQKDEERLGTLQLGLCLAAGMLLLLMSGQKASVITSLSRPKQGNLLYTLQAEVAGEQYEFSFSLNKEALTEAEFLEEAARAGTELPEWILGENKSLLAVSRDLQLIRQIPETDITVSWTSSSYRVINADGEVHGLEHEETDVVLTAFLCYGPWEKRVSLTVHVLPQEADAQEKSNRERLQVLLEQTLEASTYDAEVSLPAEFEGAQLSWKEAKKSPLLVVAVLCVCVTVLLPFLRKERQRRQQEERKAQLAVDYPAMVMRLALLLEAGMTIRAAWERLAGQQEGRRRFVYEEMRRTRQEITAGISEARAYEAFGRRCGQLRYLRFGTLLQQNLAKGSESLLPALQREAEEAMAERKEGARRLGEQAGTKLLLPMGGILILVLAIVLVPAWLSM